MPDEIATIYRDRIYKSYDSARKEALAPANTNGFAPRLPYLQQLVRKHIPSNRGCTILELGCGHGALLYALQQAGYRHAHGVDGSLEQVASAQRLGIAGVEFGDVMTTLADAPSTSYDIVIAFDFIEHFTSEIVTICESLKKSKYYFFREYLKQKT